MRRIPESEEIYERVGWNVAERRREIGVSQTELAERCGLTRGSIANIESGRQRPTLHTLSDIAEALEADMLSLLSSLEGNTGGAAGGVLAGVAARALIRRVRSSASEDAGESSPRPTEELEKQAGDLLQEAGVEQVPVSVDQIARHLDIHIDEADLGEDCSGMLIVQDKDVAVIGVNANHHEHRKRFTIAHEIAHFMLHRGEGEKAYVDNPLHIDFRATDSGSGTQQEEKEANQFAAALLMPADQVRAAVAAHPFDPTRDDELPNLARRFKVSPQAMTTRLIHLGLISDV